MNRYDIHRILTERGFKPNKKLGQNFLTDTAAAEKIAAAALTHTGPVLEVGPGLGSLTAFLAPHASQLILVEIDAGYAAYLKNEYAGYPHVSLIHGDILKLKQIPPFTTVVSNLPYYCASEILFTLMKYSPEKMVVMVQKEMASRIDAQPGTSAYGALTLNIAVQYQIEHTFNIGKNSFYPRPDVDSTVVVLTKNYSPCIPSNDIPLFKSLVKTLFWGRRKTILKCLSSSPHIQISRDAALTALDAADIAPTERGENLSLEEYCRLAKVLKDTYIQDISR